MKLITNNTWGNKIPHVLLWIVISFILLLIFTSYGTINFSLKEVIDSLLGRQENEMYRNLILNLRLPRVIGSFIVGGILALSGNILQLIIQNPLAEPYLLGISSGAGFGAVLYTALVKIYSFNVIFGLQSFSFFFAMLSTILVFIIAREGKKIPILSLVLSGVIISFLFNAFTTLFTVMFWRNLIHVNIWLLGSTGNINWNDNLIFLCVLIIQLSFLFIFSKKLNVISMGDEMAVYSGVNPELIKVILIAINVMAVSFVVSKTGIIGFVGLIIPHLIRMLKGPKSLISSIYTVIGGGIFLMAADFLSRSLFSPTELPIGVVTSLIGAPMFIYVLKKRRNKI